jgi:hypothetical protein
MCPVDGCSFGPGNRTQLEQHLISQPHPSYAEQPHLMDVMRTLQIRNDCTSLMFVFNRRFEGKDACPLRIVGCTFRLSAEEPDMTNHVITHDLVERLTYYKEIKGDLGRRDFLTGGPSSCPLCKANITSYPSWPLEKSLFNHLVDGHTRRELMIHSLELWKMLYPLYSDAPHRIPLSFRRVLEQIRLEAKRIERSTNDQPGDSGLAL